MNKIPAMPASLDELRQWHADVERELAKRGAVTSTRGAGDGYTIVRRPSRAVRGRARR